MFHLFWVVLPALRLQNYDCFWLKWCSRTTLKGSLPLAALFCSSLTRKGPTPKALNVTAKPKAATSCHWAGLAQCCHPHLSIPVPFEAWDMLQVINTFLMPARILLLSRTAPSTSPTSFVLLSSAQSYGRCKLLFMHISKHFSTSFVNPLLRKRRDAYSHQDDITASFRASNVHLFLVQWKVATSGLWQVQSWSA